MLTPPADLPEELLVSTLADGWGLAVAALAYQPVGWGSHHWAVTDTTGGRWFATADDLTGKRRTQAETLDEAGHRLRGSLRAARELSDGGLSFVVAPVAARDGEPLVRTGRQYTLALYPHLDGRSFSWGEYDTPGHREAVLEMVIAVHGGPEAARRHAAVDDFTVPHRDGLAAALAGDLPATGPYARPLALLLTEHAAQVHDLLDRYDRLVDENRGRPAVLTHGEPHPGNTMLTPDGWRLIDWDTALTAPPERDLWLLAAGDDAVLAAYATATGHAVHQPLLDLYRQRWDIADIAVDVARFRAPHTGTPEDTKCFDILTDILTALK
ncbi:phosphotransferase enzyme family protein [Catellatospora vulcania]|uniref:phosphotransferase enzyme family protein n=1 Tax=Catellatospora vulcania TaxID=1460450 RepID=UPI0012D3FA02|nr:phosphotransferase [Catellatospora vulcania]